MEEDTSKSVSVCGFPNVEGEELENLKDKLQIYFQSAKESGGGDVDHLELVEPGLIKIQFVEGEATHNVVSRTNHQVIVSGQVYPLEVQPYRPAPTETTQPHDAGQPGSPAGSNQGQEVRAGNKRNYQQSFGDYPGQVNIPCETTKVPTVSTSNPAYSPTYPHQGYGLPTYPSPHGHQQIPGQPSMNIQEAGSVQHSPHPPPSYGTVYPGNVTPSKESEPSGTNSEEGRPQSQEVSSDSTTPQKGDPVTHHHPGGQYGEMHQHAQLPQGVPYPNPSFQPYPHPQHPGPGYWPMYPGHMTPSTEKQSSGTDSEARSQPQDDSSASPAQVKLGDQTQPPPGVPYPNPSFQGPYPHPQAPGPGQVPTYPGHMTPSKEKKPSGTPGEGRSQSQDDSSASPAQTQLRDQTQPPPGVSYPNPSFQGPYPHPQAPGPGHLPQYPGHMTSSKEKQPTGTPGDGRPHSQEDPAASASEAPPSYQTYPYTGPRGPHGQAQPHGQGHQHEPSAGGRHPSSTFPGPYHPPQAPGHHHHPPGLDPRYPGYPYPPTPGYSYMNAPPPNQWTYNHPYQWTGHGQYGQQQMYANEPSVGAEKTAMPQSPPEDMAREEGASEQEATVLPCPGAQEQDGTIRDHESVPQEDEEERTGDQEEEDKTMAIEVTGLPGDELEKRREVLYNYFKNQKRSGGGDICQFDVDSRRERVLITFKDKEAPERIMQRPAHEIAKKKLKVRAVKPRRKPPVDPTRILLKGVADNVDEEGLLFYLESMSQGQDVPSEVFFGKDAGTVIVAFEEAISDLDGLLSRCEENEFEGQKMSAEKVYATDCIQVTGIPPKTSKDKLFYYFESTKRSGGGSVAEVQLDKDRDTALVFFDDYKVIERVMKQSHTIQKTTVTVEQFYTCLNSTGSEAKTPPQLVPLPITEEVTPSIASFVMNCERFKQALEDTMEKANAAITWPVGEDQSLMEITPTLTKETPNLASIAENWASNARDGLKTFLTGFDTKEIADVMQASWPQVCKLIDDDTVKDDDTISVHSTSDRKITFSGLKDSVAKHYQIVMEGKRKIEEDMKRKQSEVDETVSTLKAEQVALLAMSNFKERMTSKFPKLQMSFDTNGSKVKFHGLLDEIQQTMVKMYETVNGASSSRANLSPALISFLANAKEPKQHILGEYKRASVVAVITTTASEVEVYGLSDGDMKKAVSILNNTFQEQRLDVPHQSAPVLGTEEWKTTKTGLEQSTQGLLKISVESNADSGTTKILFTGESACVKDMMDRVHTYLKVKTIYEKQVEADDGTIRFIKEYQAANLQLQLEKHQVSLRFDGSEESPTMSIEGNSDGIQKADPILKSYIESVISDQMSIKKPGMSKHFREDSGRSTLQHVERKCKCVINIQDALNKTPAPDPDTFAKEFMPTSPTLVPLEKAVVNMDGGKKLVVWRDDITKHKADVIVNAANARLEHTGGLAKAIVDAGGDVIQKFCNKYIRAKGILIPGQVVASPPGRINTCQQILHAVGPVWKGGGYREEDDLADAVYGSLYEATKTNYRSIAIPAISSGIYGYPLKECTETIVATTVEYLEEHPETSLEVIEFVNIDDQTADTFVRALESAFGQGRVEKSDYTFEQTTTLPAQAPRSKRRRAHGRSQPPGSLSTTTETVTPPPQPRDPVAEVGFRTTEGKAITATQANIASQNVDVLVNTTSGGLNLNTGAVSKAILELAGSNLQKLVNKAKQSSGITSLPDGQILVTGSADLPCKQVIHCVLCSWDGGQGNSEKVLRNIVKQCLQQAEKGNYKSIAIPAMGTGGLRFPHDVVAEAMFNEAVEHCRANPSGSLREIRFIVWEGDPKSIPAFDEVMAKYKALHTDDASQPSPLSSTDPSPKSEEAPPFSSVGRGPGRRGRRGRESKTGRGRTNIPTSNFNPDDAAAPSLFSEVSTPVRGQLQMFIGDLTLNVRKGDLTTETTDCIVNSTNEKLDLTKGAVSNAICKAGGPNIERECANIAASGGMKGGIAVTGAGKLKSNKIIHAAAPAKATDWKTVIINCLQTADSLGLRSIAFPALGTGILQGSAAQTATTMLDALQDFVLQYKPTKLNEVRVTIFQQEMVRTFHEEMRKMVGQPLPKTKAAKASGIFGSIGRAAAAGWSYLTGGQTTNTDNPPIPSADNVVVLVIYADRADNIVEAKAMISKIMDDASKDERIPLRIKLTEELKDHVKGIAQRHDCSVTFTRSIIRVQGRLIDVMETSRDIMEFQRDVETKTNEEKHLSDKAELLLKTVQWYYIVEERQPYDSKVNYILEKAYLANETGVDFQFDGEDLHIDLTTMKETVVGDRSAVAIDVIRLEKEKEGNIKIPETWTVVSEEDPSKAVELQPSTDEYKKVHDEFMKSIATAAPTAGYSAITSAKVLKIQRIENAALWKQYMVRKKKMELDNAKSSQPVERILYHGTPVDPISSINRTGFNRSFSGRNVGAVLGNGPYFAVTASISGADQYARQDSNGHRYMYMARVLSGDMCKGQRNIIVPPAKDSTKPHITYDSVCDNATTPQIIVIFYDSQAYPEYLITFTK